MDTELVLWENGTSIHQKSSTERSRLIEATYANREKLSTKSQIHFVGYVMHAYFYNMSVSDRRYVIKMLIDCPTFDLWSEKIEMLGIMYKRCPRNLRNDAWSYIYNGADMSISKDIDCIAFCNTIRYIFDELAKSKQSLLLNKLLYIRTNYQDSPVVTTIDYTLSNIRKIQRQ